MWDIEGFRAIVFCYRVDAGGITVIRVLHGARDVPPLLDDLQA